MVTVHVKDLDSVDGRVWTKGANAIVGGRVAVKKAPPAANLEDVDADVQKEASNCKLEARTPRGSAQGCEVAREGGRAIVQRPRAQRDVGNADVDLLFEEPCDVCSQSSASVWWAYHSSQGMEHARAI